jgi:hypothetical protein
MSDIENVLVHAWNKDAINLAGAVDTVMTSKAASAIDIMTSSVAAQMFGQQPEIQNEEPQVEIADETPELEIEEPSNEQE